MLISSLKAFSLFFLIFVKDIFMFLSLTLYSHSWLMRLSALARLAVQCFVSVVLCLFISHAVSKECSLLDWGLSGNKAPAFSQKNAWIAKCGCWVYFELPLKQEQALFKGSFCPLCITAKNLFPDPRWHTTLLVVIHLGCWFWFCERARTG